jgi:anaerobic magnesium-protoporphyrin IX monomethyl ester cyclase
MTRALLVFPPFSKPALTEYAPFGIFTLAAYAREKMLGLEIKVRDYTTGGYSEYAWLEELADFKPDFVGISIITLNCTTGKLMAKLAKSALPNSLVAMGGIHAVASPKECLDVADAIAMGDGENALCELLEGRQLDSVKGLAYRRDGYAIFTRPRPLEIKLDDLPFPAYDLLDMTDYIGYPAWHIITSRGCLYHCTFCTNNLMWEGRMRSRSPNNVVDEIQMLHERYGVNRIQFQDDTINIPRQRAIDICDEIIGRGLHNKMTFMGSLRLNRQYVSQELFYKLKEAGFEFLGFGVESGSQRVLDIMNKRLTTREVRNAVRMARKAKIKRLMGFLMIGNWGETVWDVMKTWWLCLTTNMETAFSVCQPFPGTKFNQWATERGYLNQPNWEDFNITSVVTRTDRMTKPMIFIMHSLSIVLQLIFSLLRGGAPKRTLGKIWLHTLDALRLTRRRLP